ncbi:MAG: hypothetical protein FJ280_19590 [Planctomycetes bacterium]|nr:hypothetical protein [Planctomycetota bacterium]
MIRKTRMSVRAFVLLAAVVGFVSTASGDTVTDLTNGVPVTGLSGGVGSQVYYRLVVPGGSGTVEISISGGTGDCDLYVRRGSLPSIWSYHYRPYQLGNDESVSVTGSVAGTWYIMLRGNAAYSGVTLVGSYAAATPTVLANGVACTGLSGVSGSERLFTIEVPAGQEGLDVNTWGGVGNVDLYINHGSAPTPSDYDGHSSGSGNTESVYIGNPAAGTWYILLRGSSQYQGVTLRALYGAGGPPAQGQGGEVIPNLSGALGSHQYFVFHVPYNLEGISFAISGGTGDCDMYIKRGAKPTTSDYDYRPSDNGNNESVGFTGAIEGGDWYVLLVGDQAYAGVRLEVRYTYRVSPPPEPKPPADKPAEDGITRLTPGVPVTGLAGKENRQQYFSIEVPAGATNLVIRMSGGTGDADLYVRHGALPTQWVYDERPFNIGNNEQVTIGAPAAGIWYIMLRGYQSFSGVTLMATFDGVKPEDVTVLLNGVPVIGLAGGVGSEKFFQIEVPAGQTKLEIALSGGTGDADLYVRLGAKPTTKEWDYRPFLFGNNETVTIDNPKAGTYYIMVRGYVPYAGVTLKATHGPAPDDVKALANGVPVEGLSGAQDSETFFRIVVPAGQDSLSITISGGTGDADLYVKKGEKPTAKSWDYRPYLHGNGEAVKIQNPTAATWYVMVRGYQAYAGLRLEASFSPGKLAGSPPGDDKDFVVIVFSK